MKINIKEILNKETKHDENWIASVIEGEIREEAQVAEQPESMPEPETSSESDTKSEEQQAAKELNKESNAETPDLANKADVEADAEQSEDSQHPNPIDEPASAPEANAALDPIDSPKDSEEPESTDVPKNSEQPESTDVPKSANVPEDPKEPEATDELKNSEKKESADTLEPVDVPERVPLHKKYGWLACIAASFIVLLAAMFIYTTMIPREVHATINGEKYIYTSKAYTIENFLEDHNIEYCEDDYISTPLTTFIYDGISFKLKHAVDFTVTADGKTTKHKTLDNTVNKALKDEKIKVGKLDIVTPALNTVLEDNMKIVIQRVEIEEKTVEENVPFKTVNKDDSSMDEGTSKVATEGKDGKDEVTYSIKYIDGVEALRTEIARKTITAAVDKVVAKGTRINLNGISYSKKFTVKAYAYTGGGRTAMGTKARVGEIAVDPSVIPLGTTVYIEGVGVRRAEDTGGNIKGNTIDIYMNSESQCRSWGARYVTIYIQ